MSRRQFAIRLASTKEFVAVVPVNIKAGRSLTEVEAIVWDELDKEVNPYEYEYCPVHYTVVADAECRWLVPRNKGANWKGFDKPSNVYYEILHKKD